MTRPRPEVLPLALLVALALAVSARTARAQVGTPGRGSAVGGEPVPAPGSTVETMAEPEAPTPPTPEAEEPTPPTPEAEEPAPVPTPAPIVAPPQAVTPAPIAPEPERPEEDRVRLFYFEAALGYTWIDLGQFRTDNLAPEIVRIQGNGFAAIAGAGLQIAFLTVGLNGEWSRYPDFDLGTVALDVGFRLPVPVIEPYFRVGLGYGWVFDVDETDMGAAFPTGVEGIQGLVADAGIGADIPINDVFAVNLGFDAAVLSVKRQPSSIDDFGDPDFLPDEDGEAIGLQLSLLAGFNLRF